MSNPTISQIKVGDGVVYDLCDSEARNILFPLTQEAGVLKHGTKLETKNYTYVQGATNASLMANKIVLNADSWNPVMGIQTKGGGSWTIGNYNNEGLQFVYLSADRIANNTNTPNTNIIFNENGTTNLKNSIYFDNTTSRTKNTVLAAPNGSNGAASFRALVAADIPGLAASKITSGTLGADRLPTVSASAKGAMTSTQYKKLSGIQTGSITWTTTQADYRHAENITFSPVYASAPKVFLTMSFNWATNNAANAEDANGITAVVASVTTSGATITIWNKELEKNTAVTVYWVAIGSIA